MWAVQSMALGARVGSHIKVLKKGYNFPNRYASISLRIVHHFSIKQHDTGENFDS